jgi:ATP-dependent Lhr-like helicase
MVGTALAEFGGDPGVVRGGLRRAHAAQAGAWNGDRRGRNALVVAPTGSGKTLAAFLWSLDGWPRAARRKRRALPRPVRQPAQGARGRRRAQPAGTPLAGIGRPPGASACPPPDITVGMRTVTPPADERRSFARTPPDILITTPESLFLILTSAARESLRGVRR